MPEPEPLTAETWIAAMADDPRDVLLERIKILLDEKEFYRIEVERLRAELATEREDKDNV